MDDLEIKIAITYKVPKNSLTLNGLLRGLEHNRDEIMRTILGRILEALEEKAKAEYPPGRYVLNGHQSTARNLVTSFGRVRHRMAQVLDRTTGAVVFPLIERLKIEPYRQHQRETLEAPVGLAIHLSYRWAMKETRRLRGHGPSKSTLWRRLQEVAESQGGLAAAQTAAVCVFDGRRDQGPTPTPRSLAGTGGNALGLGLGRRR